MKKYHPWSLVDIYTLSADTDMLALCVRKVGQEPSWETYEHEWPFDVFSDTVREICNTYEVSCAVHLKDDGRDVYWYCRYCGGIFRESTPVEERALLLQTGKCQRCTDRRVCGCGWWSCGDRSCGHCPDCLGDFCECHIHADTEKRIAEAEEKVKVFDENTFIVKADSIQEAKEYVAILGYQTEAVRCHCQHDCCGCWSTNGIFFWKIRPGLFYGEVSWVRNV